MLVSILASGHDLQPVVLGKAKSLIKRMYRLSRRGIVYDHENKLWVWSRVSGER